MASEAIPTFDFPFSVKPQKGAKVGDEIHLFGEVIRADEDGVTVDFDERPRHFSRGRNLG